MRGSAAARACLIAALAVVLDGVAAAEPIRPRIREGTSHGFLVLSDAASGRKLAHGELIQWEEKRAIASRLVFHFDDGSLYDEVVRFIQKPAFRLESYHLVQKGPSFAETAEIEFERSGRYRVRRRESPDAEEESRQGTDLEVPADASNGMTSMMLKNLMPDRSTTLHFVTFRPDPMVLELELTPEGTDPYWVGSSRGSATRFLVKPRVPGVKGLLATVVGKQPDPLRMWIAAGRAPSLVRFEGSLYVGGPTWRIELGAPRWEK
jgi:hypothetical protein